MPLLYCLQREFAHYPEMNNYPDEEFKSDIKAIRNEVEQKFLHYHRIERNLDRLRWAKSCKPKTDKHSIRASLTARPQCSTCTNGFPESVQTIAANLEKRLQEVNVMMTKPEEMNNKTVETYRPACSLGAWTRRNQSNVR